MAPAVRSPRFRSAFLASVGASVGASLALTLLATGSRAQTVVAATDPAKVTAPAAEAPVIAPDATSFDLANGLKVVVIPDRRAPVVTHMIWYKVGAADEPAGRSGIAHYLEHLMFKGTKDNPAGLFSKVVSEFGGQENAFTASDYTAYYQRVAKEHLGRMMELEADRMGGLVLTDEVARPELKVVLEERSMRTDNDPGAILSEAMDAATYMNSPYRIPIIGWRHEIEKLTYQDALDFYRRWYTPNNAVLVVAGDVDAAEVRKLAEATYGKVARRTDDVARDRPREPEPRAQRLVTLADERVTQRSLRMSWLVPSARTAAPGESEAIDLLCEAIGGGPASSLYREFVIEKNLASSIGCWYQTGAMDDTRMMVYAAPTDAVKIEELKALIETHLTNVARNGVPEDDLARAKRRILATAIHAQDSQASLARLFGGALAIGGTLDSVKTWPSRIAVVQAPALQKAAQAYIQPEREVAAYLLPAPASGKPKAARSNFPVAGPASGGPIRLAEPTLEEEATP